MSAKGRPERELLPPGGTARSAKGARVSKPQRPRRIDRGWRRLFWLAAAVLIVAGCAAPPARPPEAPAPEPAKAELGRDSDYVIVIAQPGDDFASLAERYLGDARKGWWIAEFNNVDRVTPGQDLVVPLRANNPIGVHAGGFQTVPILCYHRFGPNRSAMTITASTFEAQMEYLARNGYRVISMAQLAAFIAGKEPLPKKAVVVTIDDGYRATYQIAFPILRKYGFPATVYLYSDFVGAADAMTWPQMQEMVKSGLIEIQPHSKSHANLTVRLPGESDARYAERIRREVEAPAAAIQDKLQLASLSFAYPYGDTNDTVAALLQRQGIRLGATVTAGGNGFFAYPYTLRRTMVYGSDDMDTFKSKLATFTRLAAK
jgi:peptidoglycan/xylan/chitin deacetylase (PgdA/CDA1 family)